MKNMKKLVSLLLALVMTFAMTMTAFADEPAPTGSITIVGTEAVPVTGKTFTAYKLLDLVAEGSNFAYSVPSELRAFYLTELGLAADYQGNIDYQVYQLISGFENHETYPDNLFDFATRALAEAKSAHVAGKSETGTEESNRVVISGLKHGYYVIEDTAATAPVSALMLDTTNPTVTIDIKADQPTIEKKIDLQPDVKVEGNTDLVDYNNAAIGDSVSYVLSSKVPDMTGYKKYYYIVTDTLSKGLTFNEDVAITVGNKTLEATDYTITDTVRENGTTFVEIVFKNFIQYNKEEYIGEDITITYSATVDTDAVIGTAGNPNSVQLEYSNNPNIQNGGEDKPIVPGDGGKVPTGKTPEDITYTYVTELVIDKINDKNNKLAGAEFTLTGTKLNKVLVKTQKFVEAQQDDTGEFYWKLKDGTYTTTSPETSGIDTEKYVEGFARYLLKEVVFEDTVAQDVTQTAVTGPDGKITFTGLSEGTYKITEIKAPTGYNLLPNPITVVIDWTAPTEGTNCTWTYTGATKDNVVTVVNQTGAELPSTGGIGTTLFYVAGTIMMFGAAVMMVSRKRQEI